MTNPIWRLPPETLAFVASAALACTLALNVSAFPTSPLLLAVLIGIAVLGLPHGALDPLIARRARLWTGPVGFAVFNATYIVIAALVAAIWHLAPPAALVSFLLISAWHFSGDWFSRTALVARLATGLALLSLPSMLHADTVSEIYSVLAGPASAQLVHGQQMLAAPAALLSLGIAGFMRPVCWRALIEISLAFLIALALPPLVFFLVYFCALHSPRHLLKHVAALSRGTPPRSLALYMLIYTSSALMFMIGGYFTLQASGVEFDQAVLRIVFIGLAALTVPHMLVLEYAESRLHE